MGGAGTRHRDLEFGAKSLQVQSIGMKRVCSEALFHTAEVEERLGRSRKRTWRGDLRLHSANDTILAKLFGRESSQDEAVSGCIHQQKGACRAIRPEDAARIRT